MKMDELRNIAKSHNIKTRNLLKVDLIAAILNNEDSLDDTSTDYDHKCDHVDCTWRRDCVDDHPN